MDDATQGLTALLGWSTDFNGSAYNLAGSIAAAFWASRSFSWYGHSPRKRKMPRAI